jgi:hypothetical protein
VRSDPGKLAFAGAPFVFEKSGLNTDNFSRLSSDAILIDSRKNLALLL